MQTLGIHVHTYLMTRLCPGMREDRLSSDVTSTIAVLVFWNGAATCFACSRILEAITRQIAYEHTEKRIKTVP